MAFGTTILLSLDTWIEILRLLSYNVMHYQKQVYIMPRAFLFSALFLII